MPTGAQEHRFAFLVAYYWHRNLKYNQAEKPLIKVFTLIILDNSAESMNASAVLIAQILIFTLSTVHKISEKCCKSLQATYLEGRLLQNIVLFFKTISWQENRWKSSKSYQQCHLAGVLFPKKSDERIEWKNKWPLMMTLIVSDVWKNNSKWSSKQNQKVSSCIIYKNKNWTVVYTCDTFCTHVLQNAGKLTPFT